MDRNEVEARLAAIEVRRRDAELRLEENARRLERLEEERAAILGDSTITQRGLADFVEHREHLLSELAAIEVEEARAEFADAVRSRDAAIERATEAAVTVVAAVGNVEAARVSLAEAHRRLIALDPAAPRDLPPEPASFDERWHEAATLIEQELGRRLEPELIEAAIRSSNVNAIKELPAHLRELALERKRERLREGANRSRR